MKKYHFLLIAFLAAVAFVGCKKETDQVLSPDQLGIGAYIRIDSTISNEFNFAQIASSSVAWVVRSVGENVSTITAYVSTNNTTNRSTWRKIKDITPGDKQTTIRITGQELATALGIAPTALSPGNQYVIFTELTTASGKKYSITNTNAELESAAAYSMAFRLPGTITCPFSPAGFAGDFRVVADQWEDFAPGDILQVTATTANSITLVAYPNPAFGSGRTPVTISVNPANGRATISPAQLYGNYGAPFPITVNTSASRNSYVFSCTGDIILYLEHKHQTAGTNYGTYLLRLKKV